MAEPKTAGSRAGLGARVGAAVVATEAPPTPPLLVAIDNQKSEVRRALPAHLRENADQFVRAALTVVKQTPGLMQCDARSVLGGLMIASQLGLEFGPLGHAYLVPFNNRKTGKKEAQFILGYKGLIDLCWRSGQLDSIEVRDVCEADDFSFDYGLVDSLHHTPNLKANRTDPFAWYGVARFTNGGHYFLVVGKPEIEAHRLRSLAKDSGPWKTDYNAMARKTVVNMMKPFLPLSSEVARNLSRDESVGRGMTIEDLEVESLDYLDAEGYEDPADPDPADDGAKPDADGVVDAELVNDGEIPILYDPRDSSMKRCSRDSKCMFADGHPGLCDVPPAEEN